MRARRGFTIVELLVVSAISIMLMTVGAFIYSNCLKIYQEGNGVQSVFETSKFINRDLRTYFGNVVPVPGAFITPRTRRFPGQGDVSVTQTELDSFYWYVSSRVTAMSNANVSGYDLYGYDKYFSGAQSAHSNIEDGRVGWMRASAGSWSPETPGAAAGATRQAGHEHSAWWMPGFFGRRNGSDLNTLKYYDIRVGSWGWPRADYRLDADADKLGTVLYSSGSGGSGGGGGAGGSGGGGGGGGVPGAGQNVACWFYAEDRNFDSIYTKTLDNSNIVLVSVKFSMDLVNNREETQLSFLRHQICGLDGNGQKWLRADQSYTNMLRAIKIEPLYVNSASGNLVVMDDAALGCNLGGVASTDPLAGREIPRAFDIRYTLVNPANQRPYRFGMRIYCQTNMQ
ncbi:MAG: prepilin-type N-terminal cleavage/methylation domain-containing protein [Planctomycetota bacterium]|nr:prepilin-type N-terminal cleavage/methylation domain-containing protein [Planctomycetota bacterium]